MYNKETEEREKALEKMSNLAISKVVHKAESISQFLSDQQEIASHAVGGTSKVDAFSDDEQVMADSRTVFLTFSKGYPISEAEVHDYFTRYSIHYNPYIRACKSKTVLYSPIIIYRSLCVYFISRQRLESV